MADCHCEYCKYSLSDTKAMASEELSASAFRGLRDEEEQFAKTGVVETTMEPTPYPHPKYSNVIVWDLPGIGTPKIKAEEYLDKVQFERYDFFILIASERFKSSSVNLAKQIQKVGKQFYCILFALRLMTTYVQKKERKTSTKSRFSVK